MSDPLKTPGGWVAVPQSAVDPAYNDSTFWQAGFPGWIFPTAFSFFVLTVCVRASYGDQTAMAFLREHFGHLIEWFSVSFAPWITYKGARHWFTSRERVATTKASADILKPSPVAVELPVTGEVGR